MKKRILSLLLLVCMLLPLVPTMALPIAAADTTTTTDEEKKVTISFRSGSGYGVGYVGDLVAQYTFDAGTIYFGTPTDAECYLKNVNPKEILGWYTTDVDGKMTDVRAYNGTNITEDLTFYPITKSSTFSVGSTPSNIPLLDATGKTVVANRGGWCAGVWNSSGFHSFPNASAPPTAWLAGTTVPGHMAVCIIRSAIRARTGFFPKTPAA